MYDLPRLTLLLVAIIHVSAAAEASSDPSSTTDKQRVGWTHNPGTRGTLNILESCLFTILACTWSVLHLNVPAPGDGPWTRRLRKAKWLFWTLLLPEYVLALSIQERRVVHKVVKLINRRILELNLGGSRNAANTEVADVGEEEEGILLQPEVGLSVASVNPGGYKNDTTPKPWTISHIYYANMGGVRVNLGHNNRQEDDIESSYYVSGIMLEDPECPKAVVEAILRYGLSENDIRDRSNSDPFTKSLAILQILWLVLSVSARKARNVASSQLEIVTLALAVMAVLIYAACWDKPQNVDEAITVMAPTDESDLSSTVAFLKPVWDQSIFGLVFPQLGPKVTPPDRVPNDSLSNCPDESFRPLIDLMAAIALVFGGLHCLAWNFEFPTEAERVIWRCASIASTTALLWRTYALTLCIHLLPD